MTLGTSTFSSKRKREEEDDSAYESERKEEKAKRLKSLPMRHKPIPEKT